MTSLQLIAVLGLLAVAGFLVYYVSTYNRVLRLLNIIPEVSSNIAVLARKRQDLITQLIAIVDSYGLHESGVNGKVAVEFGGAGATGPRGVVERLASLRLTFPELKADSLYETLMAQLAQVETDIADRREQCNAVVRTYNTAISEFPSNLLLAPFGFRVKAFLSDQDLTAGAPPLTQHP